MCYGCDNIPQNDVINNTGVALWAPIRGKMWPYWWRKSLCGDETVIRLSYLHTGNGYTGKTASLYWIVWFGCDLYWCCLCWFLWIDVTHLPIPFRVTSLTLGQSYDCPSVSEVTLKDMGKTDKYQTTTKHKLCAWFFGCNECDELFLRKGKNQWLTHWSYCSLPLSHRNIFAFSSIYQSEMAGVVGNSSYWKTRIHSSWEVNVMAADALATQGARASAVMVLT